MRRTFLVAFFGVLLTVANPLLTVASADGLPAPPWGTWAHVQRSGKWCRPFPLYRRVWVCLWCGGSVQVCAPI